jgi:hypothetical protein
MVITTRQIAIRQNKHFFIGFWGFGLTLFYTAGCNSTVSPKAEAIR